MAARIALAVLVNAVLPHVPSAGSATDAALGGELGALPGRCCPRPVLRLRGRGPAPYDHDVMSPFDVSELKALSNVSPPLCTAPHHPVLPTPSPSLFGYHQRSRAFLGVCDRRTWTQTLAPSTTPPSTTPICWTPTRRKGSKIRIARNLPLASATRCSSASLQQTNDYNLSTRR